MINIYSTVILMENLCIVTGYLLYIWIPNILSLTKDQVIHHYFLSFASGSQANYDKKLGMVGGLGKLLGVASLGFVFRPECFAEFCLGDRHLSVAKQAGDVAVVLECFRQKVGSPIDQDSE